jgi:hypothetical protein
MYPYWRIRILYQCNLDRWPRERPERESVGIEVEVVEQAGVASPATYRWPTREDWRGKGSLVAAADMEPGPPPS